MAIFTAEEFAQRALRVAEQYNTLYVMGCFGAPMTAVNKSRYVNNCAYNRRTDRRAKILAASENTFGFDCVCLIKGILWGWYGNPALVYGGAVYRSNEVPDFGTEAMYQYCTEWSSDFTKIPTGAVLWLSGHAGIYIGDGLAVEATPSWQDKVQVSAVGNIGSKDGYPSRAWSAWGKLKWIEYPASAKAVLDVDGSWGQATTTWSQKLFGTATDGIVSGQPTSNKKYLPACDGSSWKFAWFRPSGSALVRAIQGMVGVNQDGYCGPNTVKAMQTYLKNRGYYTGSIDGSMGPETVKGWQRYINDWFK